MVNITIECVDGHPITVQGMNWDDSEKWARNMVQLGAPTFRTILDDWEPLTLFTYKWEDYGLYSNVIKQYFFQVFELCAQLAEELEKLEDGDFKVRFDVALFLKLPASFPLLDPEKKEHKERLKEEIRKIEERGGCNQPRGGE